ncbi:MAG TPA: choline dehydrogenase [Gammaproteobacteria bacterium]|jgi:choline dehydrogenase|nr:choline dehydrogenase [Acidiferrobacteraceae bacterium]MDP6397766.1 choline dehydrogenase [Arenicellales bacterium]HCX87960.1 choline dehydrogenase [Gammaproteobacteria bacterium]MDP6552493.1 choline dehydrogenase [Arenicellales bacterium]MDP6853871.1 choline dehydrogenase [Arenicellales bacterium]|tara:strand:- start:29738 stop:31447 length:1710 start_codon:yes stop_codon:yes gene_type:complete
MRDCDYLIVGAGSAGCVLAARLSEDPDANVILLEAGGSDRSIIVQMPSALSMPMNTRRFNWGFQSEAEPGLDGRVLDCPRGLGLGGSSSINGMVYVRGHAEDINQWESDGAAGWNYASCLPYYQRAETWYRGADQYRGANGPLSVCAGNDMKLNPLYRAFIDAGIEAGYPATEDYNGYQQEGFGQMHMTVDNGRRASTSHAYLRPIRQRKNLRVISGTLATKVLLEGDRAIGIAYEKDGNVFEVYARAEVILSAGSIASPALLQRSGIGPARVLEAARIPVAHSLEGVGQNLQDHLEVYFQHRCLEPISLNSRLGMFSKGMIGLQWLLFKSGLGATNHFESCGFIRSSAGVKSPDIQYHFLPGAMRYDGRAAFDGHGFQVHVGPNKPASRGSVSVRSDDAFRHPRVLFNYLTAEKDISDWRACIHLTREILGQPAMDRFRGEEIAPGSALQTDDEIDAWVRQNVESAYHPSCTCKMGADDDPGAVLDSSCRVRGIAQLRVVDSSIFPTITNGNLNAPTIMAAERAADLIAGTPTLPPSEAPVWIDSVWQQSQRAGQPRREISSDSDSAP